MAVIEGLRCWVDSYVPSVVVDQQGGRVESLSAGERASGFVIHVSSVELQKYDSTITENGYEVYIPVARIRDISKWTGASYLGWGGQYYKVVGARVLKYSSLSAFVVIACKGEQ